MSKASKQNSCNNNTMLKLQAASVVASLISGESALNLLKSAEKHFRGLPLCELRESDLERRNMVSGCRSHQRPSCKVSASLRARTVARKLGEVDVFLSHSWYDCSSKKWTALQKWGEAFRLQHGREPLVWLDEACLHPDQLEETVSCIPLFVAGCSELLVLAGHTYFTRLWCLLEVYVFKTTNTDDTKITTLVLGDLATEAQQQIDVRKATCFKKSDCEKILSVLKDSVGYNCFNRGVRESLMRPVVLAS
mmetsp:Transcript_64851/g.141312  ORF Transcript_64851/g.141312 Transcript_64851/m.141312 type:complete len:250 (+) Transcript_64851:66-815(+)